jgi:hypothetical protein
VQLLYFRQGRLPSHSIFSTVTVTVRITLQLVVCSQSVHLGDKPLEDHNRIFIFQLNTCGYSPYVTSSLRRGWMCRLQLLLGLASTVILRSKSCGTHDHSTYRTILCLLMLWQVELLLGNKCKTSKYTTATTE